jgi:hypothetical protein
MRRKKRMFNEWWLQADLTQSDPLRVPKGQGSCDAYEMLVQGKPLQAWSTLAEDLIISDFDPLCMSFVKKTEFDDITVNTEHVAEIVTDLQGECSPLKSCYILLGLHFYHRITHHPQYLRKSKTQSPSSLTTTDGFGQIVTHIIDYNCWICEM